MSTTTDLGMMALLAIYRNNIPRIPPDWEVETVWYPTKGQWFLSQSGEVLLSAHTMDEPRIILTPKSRGYDLIRTFRPPDANDDLVVMSPSHPSYQPGGPPRTFLNDESCWGDKHWEAVKWRPK